MLRYPGGVTPDIGEQIDQAVAAYKATLTAHEQARDTLQEAALQAVREGWRTATVAERTGLTPGYVRQLAKDAGLPPSAKRGPRTRAERAADSV